MEIIKTTNLTKYYGKSRGIIDLNLTVTQGEFFGFIGPNGAGKSTTIRTLLGLISPTSGNAMIFGKNVAQKKESILQDIGYLPSEALFYPGMKVKDLLKLSADLRKKNCTAESKLLCERLQLDTSRKIDALSFGNRKKVAIVCALQHRPKLLVLDEPTSGLDPLMQKEFFDILRERNKEGTTIFISSHVLSECDSVEILSKTSAKRITIHGIVNLKSLDGIRDRKDSEDSISFLYSGDMDSLLRALSSGQVNDLTITEPELEEIFLHYYKKDGDAV